MMGADALETVDAKRFRDHGNTEAGFHQGQHGGPDFPVSNKATFLKLLNKIDAIGRKHRGRMTQERLLDFPQVVVEPAGTMESATDGFPDEERNGKRVSVGSALHECQCGKIGPARRAAVCVYSFAAVAPFLQLSDKVAMLPRRLALWAAAHAPLAWLDPPYTSIAIEIEMLWVERADQDGGLEWLVNELAESIGDVG
jgi:DNA-binding transcriptional LysR family regulator